MSSRFVPPISAIHFSPWTQLSGAQRSLLMLVTLQARRQPAGVLLFSEGALADGLRRSGARVSILPQRNFAENGTDLRSEAHRVARELVQAIGARVIHCHSAYGMRWMVPIAAANDLKLVCHQRDNYAADEFHRDLESANHIVAISESVLKSLPSALRAHASVVYNAVEAAPRRTRPMAFRVGMAGRSVHEKGMMFFLDSILPLINQYDFEVAIWGLWSSRDLHISEAIVDRVERLETSVRSRIHLHPFRNDIEAFFSETDIVVVPSLHPEPFGRMAMEAQAWGCVTIVAGHGGLLEIVQDELTGLLFLPGDAESLRLALVRALTNPVLCARLGRNARLHARRTFTPNGHYQKMQAIYESLQ